MALMKKQRGSQIAWYKQTDTEKIIHKVQDGCVWHLILWHLITSNEYKIENEQFFFLLLKYVLWLKYKIQRRSSFSTEYTISTTNQEKWQLLPEWDLNSCIYTQQFKEHPCADTCHYICLALPVILGKKGCLFSHSTNFYHIFIFLISSRPRGYKNLCNA